jgi:hypothetical protein
MMDRLLDKFPLQQPRSPTPIKGTEVTARLQSAALP